METRTTRRQFLTGLASLGALGSVLPALDLVPSLKVLGDTESLAPGDHIRVVWPWTMDSARAQVIHVVNGDVSDPMPVPAATGVFLPHVEIVAIPPDGRLRSGRHEFFLTFEGQHLYLGGFDVRRFHFGC